MKIISHRERVTVEEHRRDFDIVDIPGAGFSFPCDAEGNLEELNPVAAESLAGCLAGRMKLGDGAEHDIRDNGIKSWTRSYTVPSEGVCDVCGEVVALRGFTNTCDCGADYNMSGQRLAPRSQWGEDTGESVADILAIDADYRAGVDLFEVY